MGLPSAVAEEAAMVARRDNNPDEGAAKCGEGWVAGCWFRRRLEGRCCNDLGGTRYEQPGWPDIGLAISTTLMCQATAEYSGLVLIEEY